MLPLTPLENCTSRDKETGDIFFAYADRDWILDGATVHVSLVGFDNGLQKTRQLNGVSSGEINTDLTGGVNVNAANMLREAAGLSFIGITKGGDFDQDEANAIPLLKRSGNPNGKPNSDVLLPITNGQDALQRKPQRWVINLCHLSEIAAALYESPFQRVVSDVKPSRDANRDKGLRTYWWKLQRSRPDMTNAIHGLSRFIAIPRVAKYRVCLWFTLPTLTDDQTVVIAKDDDFTFGVLQSRIHDLWAYRAGTQVRERESGFRYRKECFETFPFPEPTDEQREAIADAAKALDGLRNNWLNPSEWVRTEVLEFPGAVDGPWRRFVVEADARGIGTVKYPRVVPKDAVAESELKKRTLTNLYNLRPAWLANAHAKLDAAVLAAYGWPADTSDDDLLAKLLELNLSRGGTEATPEVEE